MTNTLNKEICIVLPVINEADNLKYLIPEIHKLYPGSLILIVDDNSIDNTTEVIDQNIECGVLIKHLKRDHRFGIGYAHKCGIKYATENGYKLLCTMDADLTHDPKEIKKLLEAVNNADVIIGSRFSEGGAMENWKMSRKMLAKLGNIATNSLFKMNLDSSSSFRLYRIGEIDFLKALTPAPNSYDFFFSSTLLLQQAGFNIKDVGVKMNQRLNGESKMTLNYIFRGIARIFIWRIFLTKKLNQSN
jgi:dolichol-phosphate mannosyltransferase